MNLNINKLIFVTISTLLLMTTFAVSSEKNITYMQILQKPNDLDLNLKYAQQQGKMGNFKQTISTLEFVSLAVVSIRLLLPFELEYDHP